MGRLNRHIALLCDYRLMPERIGGMDAFFIAFDAACQSEGITVDWFFPEAAAHNGYPALRIIPCPEGIENGFLSHWRSSGQQYTHIVTHFLELCTPFFRTLRKSGDAQIICVDHNPRPPEGYPLKKKIEKRVKGFLFSRYVDRFVGVSDYTVREMQADFGRHIRPKCTTVYNGIDLAAIPPRLGEHRHPPHFLVASHLRASKGIQDLLDALALLPHPIRSQLRVDIYGEGPMESPLREKTARIGLDETVSFKGSSPELKRLYGQYDYLLQPTHMECFSLSILESLAANVPVVTTPVGGNPEVIRDGDNGLLFNVGDRQALAGLLERLWHGTAGLSTDTRSLIEERFSLRRMVENHINLLQ